MTKNLNELLDLTKQDKLAEIDTLAALAQDFALVNRRIGGKLVKYWMDYSMGRKEICPETDYHPTRDKAQAWDLMVKANLSVMDDRVMFDYPNGNHGFVYMPYSPVAVTIAFILARQGEE